jgi:hypothetical protein
MNYEDDEFDLSGYHISYSSESLMWDEGRSVNLLIVVYNFIQFKFEEISSKS